MKGYKYDYKTEPYQHQRKELNLSWEKPFRAIHWDMGTGKSKAMIDNAAALFETHKIDMVLVVSLKGVHSNWAQQEIPLHLPDRIPRRILEWKSNKVMTRAFQKAQDAFMASAPDLRWLCVNIDVFSNPKSKHLRWVLECVQQSIGRNMVILDESSTIKNPRSNRTKNLLKLAGFFRYRRTLTGTPVTELPFNLYPQGEFLKRGIMGFKSYTAFCKYFGIYELRYMRDIKFQELKGFRRMDELKELVSRWSSELRKDQVLDLPDKVYQIHRFYMTKEQIDYYAEMLNMGNLFLPDGRTVSAAENALTRRAKLYQITLGFVVCDDESVFRIPHRRVDALADVLEEIGNKSVVIFTASRPSLKEVYARLVADYGKGSVGLFYGDTPQEERMELVKRFQAGEFRYFVANQQVAGFGLTLTAAQYVVYYSNMFSLDRRLQSEDRAHRIGQHHNVTYVDLMCDHSVDEHIINALRAKVDVAKELTSLAEGWMRDHREAFDKRSASG